MRLVSCVQQQLLVLRVEPQLQQVFLVGTVALLWGRALYYEGRV